MKKKTKSKLANILFIAVCVSLSAFFLFLFWCDLNKTSVRNDKSQVASIYFKRRVAQRKYSDRVVWERLSEASPLYDKDTLRVSKEAQARIKFKNNAELRIDENTMLQILANKDGSVSINLSGGDVSIDTTALDKGSAVSVSMDNGSKMNISAGAKMTAAKNSSGENSFQIQNGAARLENPDGTFQPLKSGSAVKVSSDGKIEQKPVCVTSVGKNFELLKFEGEKDSSVTLRWITDESRKNSKIRVETSYDKDFSKIEKSVDVDKGGNSVVIENPEKSLYWRIYPLGEESCAENGKITVETVPNVALVSPVKNPVFEYRKNPAKIHFSWKGNEFASYYDFSVFNQEDLSSPLFSKEIHGESVDVDFPAGDYVWKVSPFYEIDGIGEKKETQSEIFCVVQNEKLVPAELVLPLEKANFSIEDKSSKISFAWKSDADDAVYDFKISDSADFADIVYENRTESTRLAETLENLNLDEGEYFWKITRTSSEDTEETRESLVRSFRIEKDDKSVTKLLYPPENFSVEKQNLPEISFVWRPGKNQNDKTEDEKSENPGKTQNFVVQFSPQNDFSNVAFEKSSSESAVSEISLESGKWFWRVKTADGKASAANSIDVLEKLMAPKITAPADGSSVLLPSSNLARVKWEDEENPDYFKVVLTDSLGKKIDERTLPSKNHEADFFLPGLEKQNYKSFGVSILAFSNASEASEARISEISKISFSAKNPENVVLLSPAQDGQIDGLAALRNPSEFVWSEKDKIAENTSFLVLKKLGANGSWTTVQKIKNPKSRVLIPSLQPGKYQWEIEAAGLNGVNLSSGKAYFSVAEIPHLDIPVLTSPENNFVVDAYYLKKNRSITFSWQEVDGATDYVFALYKKSENGGLKKITEKTVKKNSFKFKDLKNLDIAQFKWEVTAYLHSKNGFEEQNSRTAENLFVINFDLPKKIQTVEPGTQYGE